MATLQTIEREKCTALYGVPTMFIAELDHPEFARFDLKSLRTGIMAGAPCPVEVMKRVNNEMNMGEVTIAYGMTETSPVSFQSATDDPLERRVSTVGRIHPHVEVKVVDLEGRVVPRGERGELCTRGYSVMLGYWDEPEKTADVLDAQGWMHTGDIAIIDAEGYCNIVGRIKDMVIRGGENLYPREIEEFLYRHPKIQDVQIFGVADDRYGEELCAWIRTRPGETLTTEEVRAFCQGQIAHNKIPALRRIRRRVSDDGDRQDPEISDAGSGGGEAGAEGGEDGVRREGERFLVSQALTPPTIVTSRRTVMPREGGASSTPRRVGSIMNVSGILDRPPSRTMTTGYASAISRRVAPELCLIFTPEKQRAQGRPGARCTRGLVCNMRKKRAHEHTGPAESIRPSLRSGLTAYFVISPVCEFL